MRRRSSRPGRCVCGLLVKLHFRPDNRKLTCQQAREEHPRATLRREPLVWTLRKAVAR